MSRLGLNNTMEKLTAEQEETKTKLLELIEPGSTIYTILRHVSASGMSRVIDVLMIGGEGKIYNIAYNVAKLLDDKLDKKYDGIKIGGCGMDMGYHIVHSLGNALFGVGEEVKKFKHKTGRNGDKGYETTGGYLLEHKWL